MNLLEWLRNNPYLAGLAALATIIGLAVATLALAVTYFGLHSPMQGVAQTNPSPTPTLKPSPTIETPPPTTAAPPAVTPVPPVAASSGVAIQAFEGQWTWPYHEAFQVRVGDVLAHGSLSYYGPSPVPAGQVAEIRFTTRTGDTLNGAVESVGPGTYQFKPGDPVSITLVNNAKDLQLTIGQNNPASGVLSRV